MKITTQLELQKLTKILPKSLVLKAQNFQSKLETVTKFKKRNPSALLF